MTVPESETLPNTPTPAQSGSAAETLSMPWCAQCDTFSPAMLRIEMDDGPDRTLRLVVRYPEGGVAQGVVIYCHGLGSSGEAYGTLTETWVRQGYVVIHPTFADSIFEVARTNPHLGLDPADPKLVLWARQIPAVRPTMFQILHDPAHWRDRVRIVERIVDALGDVLEATGIDPRGLPLAIAGHSFGAYTAQLLAGAEIDLPEGTRSFRDPRFAAALVLSGQGRNQQGLRDGSWDGMTGPVLTVTGKKDGGAGGQDWVWKCEPYELAPAGDKALAVLDDANHYLGGMTPEGDVIADQFEALKLVTTAFLDAHVLGKPGARNWLNLIEDRIGTCPVIFKQK